MRVSKASKGFVFSFLAAILFGVIPLFVHLIGDLGIGVYMLVFFKNLFSLPFLILFSHMFEKRRVFPIGRMPFLQCCLMSLAGAVVTIILLFSSYSLIGTAAATSLHFLYPVFILLIGVLVFKERITWSDAVCFTLCMLGVFCLYNSSGQNSLAGALMAIASGFFWAVYSILIEKTGITGKIGDFPFLFWLNGLSLIVVGPICIATHEFTLRFPLQVYLYLIAFSVIDSVVPAAFYQAGIRLIGSRRAALIGTMEPVTSILIGLAFLREPALPRNIIGAALILISSVLLVFFSKKGDSPALR